MIKQLIAILFGNRTLPMSKLVIDRSVTDTSERHLTLWRAHLLCKVCDQRVGRGMGVGVHWTMNTPMPPFSEGGSCLFCERCFVRFALPEIRQHVESGEATLSGQVRRLEDAGERSS